MHWTRILGDDTVIIKTILFDGHVAGHLAKFERFGEPEVTYWIAGEYWGEGIAGPWYHDVRCRRVGRMSKRDERVFSVHKPRQSDCSGRDAGFCPGGAAGNSRAIYRLSLPTFFREGGWAILDDWLRFREGPSKVRWR